MTNRHPDSDLLTGGVKQANKGGPVWIRPWALCLTRRVGYYYHFTGTNSTLIGRCCFAESFHPEGGFLCGRTTKSEAWGKGDCIKDIKECNAVTEIMRQSMKLTGGLTSWEAFSFIKQHYTSRLPLLKTSSEKSILFDKLLSSPGCWLGAMASTCFFAFCLWQCRRDVFCGSCCLRSKISLFETTKYLFCLRPLSLKKIIGSVNQRASEKFISVKPLVDWTRNSFGFFQTGLIEPMSVLLKLRFKVN